MHVQVGESARLVDHEGRPAACVLRRPGCYLIIHDNERLPDRKLAFDRVGEVCNLYRLEGGEAGAAEAAERKSPGASLARKTKAPKTPAAAERWAAQLEHTHTCMHMCM